MKIAVTGASGQIGVCLVKELLKEVHKADYIRKKAKANAL